MSSGIGVKGTIGRCYPFYADLRKCVVRRLGTNPVDSGAPALYLCFFVGFCPVRMDCSHSILRKMF